MTVVYLDYNATTPVDPRVVDVMLPYFTDRPGNAASTDHSFGYEAQQAVERARQEVADLLRVEPEEVIFTSGATEANNIAILGTMRRASDDAQLVVGATEHPSTLEAAREFPDRLIELPVDSHGLVDPDEVKRALSRRTALVSVMTANNETGTIQPIDEIAAICAEAGIPFHTDAVQAAARLPLDLRTTCVSLASVSAHKMYGPKGVGALVVRRRRPRPRLSPVMHGGGHERNLRPGTLNVPAIVGFGAAASLVRAEGPSDWERERELRSELASRLHQICPDARIHDATARQLPQTLSVQLPGIDGQALMRLVNRDVAIATGSACSTVSVEPSHVLLAQGRSPRDARETVRISFGRWTSEGDVERAITAFDGAVEHLRRLGPSVAAA
ncbi:MAG TPA: cysteine desulfurase family protein [Thermoleophilaceae bacterium]|jgi:cysteine desulfurase